MNTKDLLNGYDQKNLTIGCLGGHSALDVCSGARKLGFRTVVVAQEGREKTYSEYYRIKDSKTPRFQDSKQIPNTKSQRTGCVDDMIVVKRFEDALKDDVQEKLRNLSTIFIPSRYCWVYFKDFAKFENDFRVPVFGNRSYVKYEERDCKPNQYDILKTAGIRTPKIFSRLSEIDRPVIVKVSEAKRKYERAFFIASSEADYERIAEEKVQTGQVTDEGLRKAVIEEFVVGAPVNFNFFYSVLSDELELMSTDTRRQTNLDGFLRMTAPEQEKALKYVPMKMIETGHVAVTVKESLLEKAFDLSERFVKATKSLLGHEIIGPFALQGAVTAEEGKEDIVIFDVSLRIPGSPSSRSTPYSGYLYGESLSYGERIAMEVQNAAESGRLEEIIT
jgi:5-formaminoimidazole-4-carboxamide-1-(beta)-D-ribofuranosyl 5'-monophosphate synthetase